MRGKLKKIYNSCFALNGPPGSPLLYIKNGADNIVISSDILSSLTTEQSAYFTGKSWTTYALFYADVSGQSWFNVSTMGTLAKGVALYDPLSNQHELNRGLSWFGLPIVGGWWELPYFSDGAYFAY